MTNTDRVYQAITDYWRENAIPPTIRAVQTATGISSTSLIRGYYRKLETDGLIRRFKGKPIPVHIFKFLTEGDLPK